MELYSDRHIPPDEPIDLLNIAFENPRKIRVQVDGNMGNPKKALRNAKRREGPVSGRYDPNYLVPDRSAGLSELEELRRLCPGRQWNFVSTLSRVSVWYPDSRMLGRDRRTIHGISGCSTGCELNYVAWPYSHGFGWWCSSALTLPQDLSMRV